MTDVPATAAAIEQVEQIVADKLAKAEISYTVFNNALTICVVQLESGYMLTGQTVVADPAHFNSEESRRVAFEQVSQSLSNMEHYALCEAIHLDNVEMEALAAGRDHINALLAAGTPGVQLASIPVPDLDWIINELSVEHPSDLSAIGVAKTLEILSAARRKRMGEDVPAFVIGEGTPTSDA